MNLLPTTFTSNVNLAMMSRKIPLGDRALMCFFLQMRMTLAVKSIRNQQKPIYLKACYPWFFVSKGYNFQI